MAFSFRNPIESAINALPSKFSDQALSSTSESIIGLLDDLNASFAFNLSKEVEESLIRKGVELAPISFRTHSHPACKTLENHLILRVVPLLFNKVPSISFISMREEKVEKFLKVRNFSRYGEVKALGPLNSIMDSKDYFRYSNVQNLSTSHSNLVSKLKSECMKNGWFPKVVFIHDELHFWSPKDLAHFVHEIPEINQIVGTVICPPEVLLGETISKNPRIYTFEVCGEELYFFPDGVASEGYCQNLETTTWWLKTSGMQVGDSFVRISVIGSLFSHHLICVDKGKMLQKNFFFDKPDCLLSSELKNLSSSFSESVIERSTMLSILTYLSCLKSPNKESALAKLRQLEKRDLFPDEAYLVSSISSTFIKYGVGEELDKTIFEKFFSSFRSLMPGFVQDSVDKKGHWYEIFRSFMKEISIKHFRIVRSIIDLDEFDSIPEPTLFFNDRPEQPYSFIRNLNFIRFLSRSNRVGDNVYMEGCPFRDTLAPRRVDVHFNVDIFEGPSPLLFIRWKDEEARLIENSSVADQFSSSGLVIQNEMFVKEFEKPSISFRRRRNSCVFDSISHFSDMSSEEIIALVFNSDISGELFDAIESDLPLSLEMIQEVALASDFMVFVEIKGVMRKFNLNGRFRAFITLDRNHAEPMAKGRISSILASGGIDNSMADLTMIESLKGLNQGTYSIDLDKAAKLATSFKRGCTGILLEISPNGCSQLAELVEAAIGLKREIESVNFSFGLKLGIPGSGKSFEAKKFLMANPTFQTLIVSPRRALAEDWSGSVKGTLHRVKTFESALCEFFPSLRMLILDEITLYPPGFLDLILLVHLFRINGFIRGDMILKSKAKDTFAQGLLKQFDIIALGDVLQTQYYSSTDSQLLSKVFDYDSLIKRVKGDLHYLWFSRRLPKGMSDFLDFECLGDGIFTKPRVIAEVSVVKAFEYSAFLVASQEDKRNANLTIPIMTFGESQGLTFEKKVLIMLSSDTIASSENSILVALTRSKIGFDFVFSSGRSLGEFKLSVKKKILGYVLDGKAIPEDRFLNLIPHKSVKKVGVFGNLEEKASNDLFILPVIQPNYVIAEEEMADDIEAGPTWLKTHLPLVSVNPLLAETFKMMEVKEKREFWHISRGFSEQFPDTDKGLVENVMGYAFRFDAIFPRHNGSDDTTFWEGVKKRLRFSDPRRERSKLESSRVHAKKMVDIFLKALPNNFEVGNMDLEYGLNSFNNKRAEKPNALWIAHSNRSEIDWPLNHVFLFMKSQLCTKQEKMFTKAKAGQTLACFHHAILFKFGPILRAIERAFIRACGESYYIHSGKNFFSLNEFVLKNQSLFQGRSIESDYEAFDSSQDSMILAFEEALLKKIGLSQGFIDDYLFLKLNLGCRLGSFAIMRFTGEFCTFLFNTFANMLFTFIKYDVRSDRDRILFAGDDMASLGGLKENSQDTRYLLDFFSLKAKEEVKKIPSFCGWYLTPDGILKSPKLLWARICTMKQRGLIDKCLDNYFLEAVFAYNLGEKLFAYFDEEQIEFHYAVSRFFVENKFKFTGEAKLSFFGSEQTFGSKCQLSESMTSESELIKKMSRSTLSNRLRFMVMFRYSLLKFYKRSEGLRPTSKLAIMALKRWPYQILSYLIKLKSISSEERQRTFLTSILARFWCALHPSSQILGKLKEKSCSLMDQQRIRSLDLLLLMRSILKKGQHCLSSGPSIYFPRQILFLQNLSKLQSNSKESILKKGGKFLGWTLGVCIGYLIRLGLFVKAIVIVAGRSRRFGDVSSLSTQNHSRMKCFLQQGKSTLSQLTSIQNSLREDFFYLIDALEERKSSQSQKKLLEGVILGCLGQPHLNLIRKLQKIVQMASVQHVIQLATRRAVNQWLWDNCIDQNHQILEQGANLDAVPGPLTQSVTRLLQHYKIYLFGNIAVLGSSGKTAWPNLAINLPALVVMGPQEANVTVQMSLNMATLIPALEVHRSVSNVNTFKESTFRQVCECFAAEAYTFLKAQWSQGVSSNIYKKWPRALESAPWVAFDFCSGLRMNELTPDERKVVDRLTKRLFRTEGQKGVYEAGQEVNVDLEG